MKVWEGKVTVWGRRICIAGIAAWLVACMANGQNAAYSVIKVICLFGILLMGYRYGPGAGAITGTACGMVFAIWNGDLVQLGILSIIGMMSGAFRALGKFAAAIGYLTTVAGIALLYAPSMLRDNSAELFAAVVLFLILPIQITMQEEKRQTVVTVAPAFSDMDGSIGIRLRQMEEAFIELGKIFSIHLTAKDAASSEQEMRWRTRYLENRSVSGEQLLELAELMHGFREELNRTVDITKEVEDAIRRKLSGENIEVGRVMMMEGENKRSELILTLSAKDGKNVPVKALTEMMQAAIGRRLLPAGNALGVIGAQSRTIRMEEEPRYQMLHGVARTIKENSQRSGDSFSFLGLPRGRVLLSLCDGMGSGTQAFAESSKAIELTEQLLEAGFHPQTVLRLVNNALVMQEDYHPLAMDVAVVDLYNGICDFTKSGAAITIIRHGGKVEILQSETLPIGVVQETMPMESLYRLRDGDLIIMMTDGVLEAMPGVDKEDRLKKFCRQQDGINPTEIAEQVLGFALEQDGKAKDDMTVLVAGIWKR